MSRSGRKPALDQEQIEKIKVALLSGAAVRDLAKRFGVSCMTFARLGLTKHKIAPKQPARRKKKGPRFPFSNWRAWSVNPNQ
jgi:hypothetical protein